MVPSLTAVAKTAASPVRRLGFVYMPMGCDITRLDAARRDGTAGRVVAHASVAAPRGRSADGHQQSRAAERLPRHARDVQRLVPERRQGEVDREHRLLPGHDRRSGRRAADRPADATAVARAVDGSAADGRPVRQRLRVRLPEQPLVVVADDAAARRGASAASCSSVCSAKAAAPPTAAPRCGDGPACSTSVTEDITRLQTQLGPGDRARVEPVSRHRPRSGAAHPEGRGATPRTIRCRISIGRWASRLLMPTTPG